ncbi:hypothetical protein [Terasakiella pusilla]|uniref:hypothetical protein n=1 Tax=Terasakiella pusilla TaxID=64973 RepID=UPI00048C9682|nr:hypothetical protein [Terasakiella pusilla]
MKIDEISTMLLPSIFYFDIEFTEIELDGTKVETIDVKIDAAEATVKGVSRTRYGLSIKVEVVLVSDDKAAVTRAARGATVMINDRPRSTNFGLVSDIIEINDHQITHYPLEELEKVG